MKVTSNHIAKSIGILLGGILLFFLLSKLIHFRIDLTEEKRYSLHAATEEVLSQLTEPVHVEIMLVGEDMPGGMRRLQRSVEETVRTFNAYSPEKITYSYFDPLSLPPDEQEELILQLADYGINPTNLYVNQTGGQQTKLIFPGVLVYNEEYEAGALILKGEKGMSQDQTLNQSIENLEFELSNAIRKLNTRNAGAIAMLIGHDEMQEDEGYGIVEALDGDFEIFKVPLEQARTVEDLINFETIFIQGPRQSYTERDVFLLDQYVMHGGNLIVLSDGVAVDVEQAGGEGTLAMPYDNGLENLLFKYGVRINKDLIQDLNFGYFPVMGGDFGNLAQMIQLPWPFYIQASRMASHPITKGLDVVYFRFASTMDTVLAPGIKKTPLIFSSDYTRVMQAPARVAFSDMEQEPNVNLYNQKNLPLVYLLEGEFTSLYKNRFLPEGFSKDGFKESGSGKVVVISDGEVFQSQTDPQSGAPLSLGDDPFNQVVFANKLFLRNLVQYLQNPEGLIASRTRTFQIRPLDKVKVAQQKTFWQGVNVLVPVILLLICGGLISANRVRKYSRKN
ncbi:gliding motility-associated ABC transporter substrate-binding protein GldG [Algoriphagus zhangzhouensis]|uniref:Gliding-associated putative ABC transporter substrate-binding component GldG n=1 Tax=Algoriphagus zhangzhouensis TaxID=1073327 RepID=A0A1M7Z9E3_9BACT|nr:gliding motility-associated ABC transporter substrate-binding protein GldG [Algoriphagus zhangzhouensis]TDY47392.1 gliding-associated putative ABC transporter substrate-binding component GldG [Algoriphagus zhangzhouensis]SHO61553.1 gliding-associated putative ABC transporter substrate-binding component GldG [Algoriphagus zhangzhouensis]